MKLNENQIRSLLQHCEYDHKKINLYADCPKCGHHEFGISLTEDNHPFQCFRKKNCGWSGNIYTLLKFLNKTDLIPRREIDIFQKVDTSLVDEKVELDLNVPEINKPIGFKRITTHDYLVKRGFRDYDFVKYEIGVSQIDPDYIGYIVILIYQFGKLCGHIGRYPKSKKELDAYNKNAKKKGKRQILRYKNSKDTDFSKLLLGIDEVTENTTEAFLVEGVFDKINLDKILNLDLQEKLKCLVTFKGNISDEQIALIKRTNIKKLYVMYDGDIVNTIKKNAAKLENIFESIEVIPLNENDPGDMDEKEFRELFAKKMNVFNYSVNRVQILIK